MAETVSQLENDRRLKIGVEYARKSKRLMWYWTNAIGYPLVNDSDVVLRTSSWDEDTLKI